MTPIVVRQTGRDEDWLLIGFSGRYWAVVVLPDGRLINVLVADLVVERPSPEFPLGYGYSRGREVSA